MRIQISLLKNSKGSSLIPALVIIMLLGYGFASLLSVKADSYFETVEHLDQTATDYIALGLVELAKLRLNIGKDPSTTQDVNLNYGSGEILADPVNSQVTINSTRGKTSTSYTVNTNFSKDCIDFNGTPSFSFGSTLGTISSTSFRKTCLDMFRITDVTVDWTGSLSSQKVVKIRMDSSVYYTSTDVPTVGSPTTGAVSGETIDIADMSVSTTSSNTIDYIMFEYPSGNAPTSPTTFTVTFHFLDGSSADIDYIL